MNKEPMAPLTEPDVALSDGLLGDVAGGDYHPGLGYCGGRGNLPTEWIDCKYCPGAILPGEKHHCPNAPYKNITPR